MKIKSEISTSGAVSINICVLKQNGYIHTEAFRDLAERIEAESYRRDKLVTISSEESKIAGMNIVLGGHVDARYVSTFDKEKLLIVNLERLEAINNSETNKEYLNLLNQSKYVDFSSQNTNYCRLNNIHLPEYLYRPWYEPRWERTIQKSEKIWDACFIGSMTPRRENICQELIRRGVKLKISSASYSSERDEILSKSKYVLNLHAYAEDNSAEIFRLNYYASNKLRCISEICDFEDGESGISDSLTQYAYEDFSNKLCELIVKEPREEYDNQRFKFAEASLGSASNEDLAKTRIPDKPTILNLNCGFDWKEDAINIDPEGGQCEDMVIDMSLAWHKINSIHQSKRHGKIHFSENSFDAVVMIGLLETCEYPIQLLENITKLMKPGGWLYIKSSHQDGLEAWAGLKTKRAINEEFITKLQSHQHFKNLQDASLQIKWINFEQGINSNKINPIYQPRTEYIETVLIKCIKKSIDKGDEIMQYTSIKERKELGMTSSREQLHRKTNLMERMNNKSSPNKALPRVSLLTPTSGSRFPHLKLTWKWINQQSYPKELMEWVILTDTIEEADILKQQKLRLAKDIDLSVKISSTRQKQRIGLKRNMCHKIADGEILINFDDDDYYFPDRVSHAVEKLTNKNDSNYELAGAQELPVYFLSDKSLWISKPGPNLACAGSFAYKKSLLTKTWYSDLAKYGEELSFTDNYRMPIMNLDPFSTMICIAHQNNTFDKNKLRERSGQGKENYIEIKGKKLKGSPKFFCINEDDALNPNNEWEREYEWLATEELEAILETRGTSVFTIENENEQGIAQLALKLHKRFISR